MSEPQTTVAEHPRSKGLPRWLRDHGSSWLLVLLALVGLSALARQEFLIFHMSVELLSVVVLVAVFSIGWNTRAFVRDNLLLILAVSSLPIGVIDALHLMTYKGMSLVDVGGDPPTQFWVAARGLESVAFLLGALSIGRRPVHATRALWAFAGAGTLLTLSVLPLHIFPTCYVDGVGLTPFKIVTELIVAALMCVAGAILWKRRRKVAPVVLNPLLAALGARVLSELCFTAYINVYGPANELGHVLKLLSAVLVYRALVEGTLRRPYQTLFHELAASEEELQRELTERRRAQAQLAEAKAAAEAANKAKSDFLANMSHEVRTPMNAIKGATELVLGTQLTAEQREFLGMARASADSLLNVINDILDFSKIEAGKFNLESVTFDLPDTVERAVEALALSAHEKDLDLACSIGRDVPRFVVGDSGRLRQVLINLLGNAIKFTKQGEVVLRVTAPSPREQDKQALRFSVADTGPGIPSAVQERVFSSFFQADSSLTRKSGGTGLGLTISRRIIKCMGGSIRLDSTMGSGTTFYVDLTLPVVTQSPEDDEQLPALQGRRALVVDGHRAAREVVCEMLEGCEQRAEAAASMAEAFEMLRKACDGSEPYSLAIIDGEALIASGSALDVIRRDKLVEGPIVAMWKPGAGNAAKRSGLRVDAQLIKPVRRTALCRALQGLDAGETLPYALRPSEPPQRESEAPVRRILVVEDNPVNRRVATALLQRVGHDVVAVGTGLEALEMLARERFDVVLMDVQMPEMDGLEATRMLRERPEAQGGRTPVIGLTAHAMQGDKDRCLAAGMTDYLTKPFRAKDLVQAIQRHSRDLPVEPTPRRSPDGVVQLDGFRELVGDDDGLVREIIGTFLEDLPGRVSDLRSCLTKGDAPGFMRAAHGLKGSVSTFGATRAQQLAAELESMGREGRLESVQLLFERLLSELDAVRDSLASEVPGSNPPSARSASRPTV